MKKLILSFFLMASIPVSAQKIVIQKGTQVPLQSRENVSASDAGKGQIIEFEVVSDVLSNGIVLIPRGAIARAEIKDVSVHTSMLTMMSYSNTLKFSLKNVILPDGMEIPLVKKEIVLKGSKSNRADDRTIPQIPRGYKVSGTVASNVTLRIKKPIEQQSDAQIEPKEIKKKTIISSDVDQNIPRGKGISENTFAIIIANENYSTESKVEYALHDGQTFKTYCLKTLGLPEENVHYIEDATKNNIEREIDWVSKVANAFGADSKVIIYYAGHGIPDEKSGMAYLLPVDGIGTNIKTGYSTAELYKQLASLPSDNVVVLMDACFSGTKRGEGMLTASRGVAIKSKMDKPQGNLVVLTAAQGDETAHPYHEKGHGLFTYFMLKKLQESKGNCSLQELGDYVRTQVSRRAIIVNGVSQTPTLDVSEHLRTQLSTLKLK